MKTKNISKALAFAMLIPAILLTTACSSDDYDVITEKANPEGYKIPVTVNVTRQDDVTTRAEYDGTNRKLTFDWGDLLFVNGTHATAGQFAGTLDWQSDGTFTGTISTQYDYSGTANALLSGATTVEATLLPDGYNTCKFLVISGSGYSATLSKQYGNALTLDKASAVEQLSYEHASTYSSGFALAPGNAIVSFTIGGLTANRVIIPKFNADGNYYGNDKYVIVNTEGAAVFAIGVDGSLGAKHWYLADLSSAFSIDLGNKSLEAGHIYNITRMYKMAASAASTDIGKLICTGGHIHTYGVDDGCMEDRVAMIAYVGSDACEAGDAPYNHGLALALMDANNGNYAVWCSQRADNCLMSQYDGSTMTNDMAGIANTDVLVGTSPHNHGDNAAKAARNYKYAATADAGAHPTGTSAWFLPSAGQWAKMATAAGGYIALRDGFSSVGGTKMRKEFYWSSTERTAILAWFYNFEDDNNHPDGHWHIDCKDITVNFYVRACLAF